MPEPTDALQAQIDALKTRAVDAKSKADQLNADLLAVAGGYGEVTGRLPATPPNEDSPGQQGGSRYIASSLLKFHEGLLIFSPEFAEIVGSGSAALRRVVAAAATAGLPVPAFSAALAYLDTMRQARGTTDLIQGQRDFFGAHGFERVDDGTSDQHGPWAMGLHG